MLTRGKDARDFQRRSLSRFLASRASRYASHPTFLVAKAFALRVFIASYTFYFRKKKPRKKTKERRQETRPDTWPPVADGWAGVEMRVSHFSTLGHGPTDGWTKPLRVAYPQLKM